MRYGELRIEAFWLIKLNVIDATTRLLLLYSVSSL
jgi:hypothetical protein